MAPGSVAPPASRSCAPPLSEWAASGWFETARRPTNWCAGPYRRSSPSGGRTAAHGPTGGESVDRNMGSAPPPGARTPPAGARAGPARTPDSAEPHRASWRQRWTAPKTAPRLRAPTMDGTLRNRTAPPPCGSFDHAGRTWSRTESRGIGGAVRLRSGHQNPAADVIARGTRGAESSRRSRHVRSRVVSALASGAESSRRSRHVRSRVVSALASGAESLSAHGTRGAESSRRSRHVRSRVVSALASGAESLSAHGTRGPESSRLAARAVQCSRHAQSRGRLVRWRLVRPWPSLPRLRTAPAGARRAAWRCRRW
jgi:hypothetical protein